LATAVRPIQISACQSSAPRNLMLPFHSRDAFAFEVLHRIEPGEPYFHDLSERWSAALRAVHRSIPRPPYGREPS
jgi:predicted proteasome-type protease